MSKRSIHKTGDEGDGGADRVNSDGPDVQEDRIPVDDSWTDYQKNKAKYKEHCSFVASEPDLAYLILTWEEFLCQSKVDENKF